jgi:hypothetical protein
MIGSTFIYTQNSSALAVLVQDLETIDRFAYVEMESLITLDFEIVCQSYGVQWASTQPVVYDEEAGLTIFKVVREGIRCTIGYKDHFRNNQLPDIEAFEGFIAMHGADHIYELATF